MSTSTTPTAAFVINGVLDSKWPRMRASVPRSISAGGSAVGSNLEVTARGELERARLGNAQTLRLERGLLEAEGGLVGAHDQAAKRVERQAHEILTRKNE